MVRRFAMLVVATGLTACSLPSLDVYTRETGSPIIADAAAADAMTPGVEAAADASPRVSAYRAAVLADEPTAYYRFGEPSDASVVTSETGIAVVGAIHGQATLGIPGALAGDDDHALLLDGASGSVSFGNYFAYAGGASYTIEVWFRADVNDENYRRIWNRDATNATGRQGYTLYVRSDLGVGAERYIDNQLYYTHYPTVVVGKWTHAVVTYDQTVMRLYVDGALVDSTPSPPTMPATDSPFVVGSAPFANGFFRGAVDELALYDQPLTDARIAEHHRIGAGL